MTLSIAEHYSLRHHNTLAVDARARYCVTLDNPTQVPEAIAFAQAQQLPWMVIGQGSNIVFRDDYPGVVMVMALTGIATEESGEAVELDVSAGESWHRLVMSCVEQGLGGIENLALIPGTVGAAPIQNIGAYGVELADVLVSVSGWHTQARQWQTLARGECQLAYRDSLFKRALKDRFIITGLRLRLHRQRPPHIDYQPLRDYFRERHIDTPTPLQVAEAVIAIRRSKLPDPARIPNAGSFFKNPVISADEHSALRARYPQLVSYPLDDGRFKLAAGWLIEQAGWKGMGNGRVAMHERQALVLVNPGGADGAAILAFAERVRGEILAQFGVALEVEPAIY